MSRVDVSPSALSVCVINEAVELVNCGFMQVLSMIRVIGKVCVSTAFVYCEHAEVVPLVILFPLIMCSVQYFTIGSVGRLRHTITEMEIGVVQHIHESGRCFRIMTDYQKR